MTPTPSSRRAPLRALRLPLIALTVLAAQTILFAPAALHAEPIAPQLAQTEPAPTPDRFDVRLPPPESERRYLDAEDFRTRYENRTVHLSLGPDHYGSEQYLPDDITVWIFRDGRCQRGTWTYADQLFCFNYDPSAPDSCWRVFDGDGATWAETDDRALALRIYKVEREPLACNDFISRAPEALTRPATLRR